MSRLMPAVEQPDWQSQDVYWEDYDNHPQLKLCSWAAQGLLPRLLKVMWFSNPRGYFLEDGCEPVLADLAELWTKPIDTIVPLIAELEARRVLSRNELGVLYCRRMVNDEKKRVAKEARRRGESVEDTPTGREALDMATRAAIDAHNREEEKRAKQRARQARYKERKRRREAITGLEKMAALEHMAAVNARNAGASAAVSADAQSSVTMTSPPVEMTRQHVSESVSIIERNLGDDALSPPPKQLPSSVLPQEYPSNSTIEGGVRSLAMNGDRTPSHAKGLQARVRTAFPEREPIRAPSESEEAFQARLAAWRAGRAA